MQAFNDELSSMFKILVGSIIAFPPQVFTGGVCPYDRII